MALTMTGKRDIPPSDPDQLADWLAPRPGESYENWSRRFDRAERTVARRKAAGSRSRRRRGSTPGRRAA